MIDLSPHHPEVIILDLTDVFADAQRRLAHTGDVNLLLPSMVSSIMTCVECRDPDMTRLEVYVSDLIEQFKNDGMPTEDGEIAAAIAKDIGRKLVYEIEKIGGYDENDNFDYDVYRVEISGAVVLTRLDPVGARAQEKRKEWFPDPEAVGKSISSGSRVDHMVMVDDDGNPIKTSVVDIPEPTQEQKDHIASFEVKLPSLEEMENHPHQGYFQGQHNVQYAAKLGEVVTPEQQLQNYEAHERRVVIEENVPAAGFRSRTEYDLPSEDFTSSTVESNISNKIDKMLHSPKFNMKFAPCDDLGEISVRLNGQTIQNPTPEQLSEVANKLGFDAADVIMGQDKGYREVPLSEVKESPYKEILDNAFQDQERVIINAAPRYVPLGIVDGDQQQQKWKDTTTGEVLTNEERFNRVSKD